MGFPAFPFFFRFFAPFAFTFVLFTFVFAFPLFFFFFEFDLQRLVAGQRGLFRDFLAGAA